VRLLRWEGAPEGVRAAFSTREGGVSEGPYRSLNLGVLTGDEPGRVVENRRRLCEAAGVDPERATMAFQVHGAAVREATPTGVVTPGTDYERSDGLWTDRPGQGLMLVTADCLPIALARTDGSRLVVLHAGWRGLLAGIVEAGSDAARGETVAAIGPGIGPCCYEVGEEVAAPFRERFGPDVAPDGRLDLALAAGRALEAAGVVRVERVGGCTCCDPDAYFSHRRDRGTTGRQGIVAALA
jgi:hypothetical protein